MNDGDYYNWTAESDINCQNARKIDENVVRQDFTTVKSGNVDQKIHVESYIMKVLIIIAFIVL
jgi:hypothetical protein